jgi:hypothetical protein
VWRNSQRLPENGSGFIFGLAALPASNSFVIKHKEIFQGEL